MKNLIIFEQRRFEYYDIPHNYQGIPRMVAVLTESGVQNFPAELRQFFAKIYTIPNTNSSNQDAFSAYRLNKSAACAVIEEEISIAGGSEHIDLVCNDEFNIQLMGWLRDKYAIPGAGEAQLTLYRDKDLMKQRLAQQGIRVPRHRLLDTQYAPTEVTAYFQQLTAEFGNPLVIKPLAGAGSISTHIVREIDDFIQLYLELHASKLSYEVEEFITGNVYHCDSLVQGDQIIFAQACEYMFQDIDYPKGKMHVSIPLLPDNPLAQRIYQFNDQVIHALGHVDGSTHMEFFYTPEKELVFIEIAARAPGGDILTNYWRNFGIKLMPLDLRIHAGEKITIIPKPTEEYFFTGRIPYVKGKVTHLNKPDIGSKYHIDWKINPGDIISHNSLTPMDFCASFWVSNPDYQQLYQDFKKFRQYQPYQVVGE